MSDADLLSKYLDSGPERGGVILADGTLVELDNVCDKPDEGFYPDADQLLPHIDHLVATWHTHPGHSSNLSVEDSNTYVLWPELDHYIIGSDGIRRYRVKNGMVVNA